MVSARNLTKTVIDKNLLKGVAKIVLKGENVERDKELSIVLVKGTEIKKLNQKYRKKNQTTDVLAFGENFQFPISNFQTSLLGEIVICPEKVKKNAKEIGSTFKKELIFVLIHGILHLLGYEHKKGKKIAKTMEEKTKKYLFQILTSKRLEFRI